MTLLSRLLKIYQILLYIAISSCVLGQEANSVLKSAIKESKGEVLVKVNSTPGNSWTEIIETKCPGQAILLFQDGTEIRIKENSHLVYLSPRMWRVEKGLVGFKTTTENASLTIEIFPGGLVTLNNGIAIFKVYSSLFRIGLLQGTLKLKFLGEIERVLTKGQEIAGCFYEISSIYGILEDLRFAWYW